MWDGSNHSNGMLRKKETGPWMKFFAYRPVRVHGELVWLQTVYRRRIHSYVDMENWTTWEYGNLFDIVKQ